MIASQMESARIERTTIDMETSDGRTGLRANGQVVLFDGYLAVYEEGRDDESDEDGGRLPMVKDGASAKVIEARADQHFTEPPPRYSEASLVKKMEELGIGRPSTYASILTVLRERDYVRMEKNRFIPEDKGRLVTAFLEQFFRRYVEYDFTAALEEKLDLVSAGELEWKQLLRDFWKDFHAAVGEIGDLRVTHVLDALNIALGPHIFPQKEDGSDPRACPTCGVGQLSLKTGKFGAFIGCSNYPECRFTRTLANSEGDGDAENADRELGAHPVTEQPVWLKIGRFGPYVEMTEGDKLKRSSLPKGWTPASIDLEKALRLLSLPREVGIHPEDNAVILAGIGRYGPYVQHSGTYANLESAEEVFEVGLNRAVTVLAEKRAGGGRGRGRTEAAALKDLGVHPETGKPVKILSGRFGPYIKHGETNANVPKGSEPADLTLEEAVRLLAEREAKGGVKKKKAPAKAPAKAKAEKAAPVKKVTAKKPAAKKPAAKKAPAKKAAAKAKPA
ncbi:MAG: hypothetical protein RLZZ141_1167 [Pseudomonadota bacterium]